jgi:hypothetical protein
MYATRVARCIDVDGGIGRSVGIVRSRTKGYGDCFFVLYYVNCINSEQ